MKFEFEAIWIRVIVKPGVGASLKKRNQGRLPVTLGYAAQLSVLIFFFSRLFCAIYSEWFHVLSDFGQDMVLTQLFF